MVIGWAGLALLVGSMAIGGRNDNPLRAA